MESFGSVCSEKAHRNEIELHYGVIEPHITNLRKILEDMTKKAKIRSRWSDMLNNQLDEVLKA